MKKEAERKLALYVMGQRRWCRALAYLEGGRVYNALFPRYCGERQQRRSAQSEVSVSPSRKPAWHSAFPQAAQNTSPSEGGGYRGRNKARLLHADVELRLDVLGIRGCGGVEFVIGFVGANVAELPLVFGIGNPLPRWGDDLLRWSSIAQVDGVRARRNAFEDQPRRNVGRVRHSGADDHGIVTHAFVGEVRVCDVDVLIRFIGDFLQDAFFEEFLPLLWNYALTRGFFCGVGARFDANDEKAILMGHRGFGRLWNRLRFGYG